MAAVQETDDLSSSPGTRGVVVGPRVVGEMAPTTSPKFSNAPRESLRPSCCHHGNSIRTTEQIGMVSPVFPEFEPRVSPWRVMLPGSHDSVSYIDWCNHCSAEPE